MNMREYRILSPTGIVGYGFPKESFELGVAQKPDLIACDAGSTDPGPYYLGSGKPFTTATAVKRDLALMLQAACELGIPLVIGSAGGSGGDIHLKREFNIVCDIAKEYQLTFKLATISAEFKKDFITREFREGRITALGAAPFLTIEDIEDSTCIVAQMGIEPIIKAMDEGAQVILAGRCYDPAPFAAPAVRLGYDRALAIHLGKLLECAAIAAVPGSGSDCMMGYLYDDSFSVEPLSTKRKCTITSVSAHTLYEKSNPYLLPGPGGVLNISACDFIQETDRRVKVRGSIYDTSGKQTVKLEGSKKIGFRTICICGNRDPIFISQIQSIIEDLRVRVAQNLSGCNFRYTLDFILYGLNGVMGNLEPETEITSHELGMVIDVVADSQEDANTVCSVARSTLLHHGYEGRIATAGNLAFPYSPSDIQVGEVYKFSLYHLLETDEPARIFPRTHYEFKRGARL
ncbi:MAG: acyclic terpene utilization AtuA family protein [Spirochaetia bacterium]|jgi:hypothetical protein|nr:acyclic terpene utilization AtuA family protein [Spirochaetia bacterium]